MRGSYVHRIAELGVRLNGLPTMTAEAFAAEKPSLDLEFKGSSVAVAEAVLVRGLSPTKAAEELKTTRQNVSGIVRRVVKFLEEERPEGWVPLKLLVPPEIATEVEERVAVAKAEWLKNRATEK